MYEQHSAEYGSFFGHRSLPCFNGVDWMIGFVTGLLFNEASGLITMLIL